MSRGRLILAAALCLIVLAGLVAVGRWERSRHASDENRGMARVLAVVGPLDNRSLSGFRVFERFHCLTYRRGATTLALEVCVDFAGRVIETIDRRSGEPRISSLREDPTRATNRVDRELVDRLLRRMGVKLQ